MSAYFTLKSVSECAKWCPPQALEIARGSRRDNYRHDIHEKAGWFIFLGTPHHGSRLTWAGELITLLHFWEGSATNLLKSVALNSTDNAELHHNFMAAYHVKNMVCFFEAVKERYLGFPVLHVREVNTLSISTSLKRRSRQLLRFCKNRRSREFWI